MVDATPETETALRDSLANLERAYGAKGVDMTQFPTLNFTGEWAYSVLSIVIIS